MVVEIIVVGVFAALVAGRLIWEKRTSHPEPRDSEAVGGWFGNAR